MYNLKLIDTDELTIEKKYQLLLQLTEKISATLNLDELLSHLIDTVRSVVAYDAAGIFIVTRSGLTIKRGTNARLIEGMVTRGFEMRVESDPMLNFGEGIIGHVIRTGQSIVLSDVQVDPRYVAGREQTRSEIAVPMKLGERVVGALNLESDCFDAFTETDLEVLQFFANVAAISIEKAMLHRELIEKKRIESQLEVARQVQSSLLPIAAPSLVNYSLAGVNIPTYEVGGDYYDYIDLPDNELGLIVADVSGKGVPAALIMSMFRAALRTQVRNISALAQIMQAVNLLLWESTSAAQFVTAIYGALNPRTHQFSYTNCGHNPPLLIRHNANVETLESGGVVLGAFDLAHYEEATVSILPGDTLVLYTDGVVETLDEHGEEFGEKRLIETLLATRHLTACEMVDAVQKATQDFSSGVYQDDFTFVVLKRETI